MNMMPVHAPASLDLTRNAIRREGVPPFCHYPPGRDDRSESLEAIRYTVLTMQELVEAIQNQWPPDRKLPADLQSKLHFAVFALARVRNGEVRRMAENAKS